MRLARAGLGASSAFIASSALVAVGALGGCHGGALSVSEPRGNLRTAGPATKADPTVRGARLVPEIVEEDRAFGVEPGGGVRTIVAGIRVVSQANGALLASEDRLPKAPSITLAVPERMGGGFLFVLDSTVWRAGKWLERAKPIHASPWSVIARVVVGLDRVYLKSSSGAFRAIDPRTGAPVDAGAFPGAPYIGAFGALDGWRAVAVADLRGAMATFDAGASWKPLGLPIDAKDVVPLDEGIAVGGMDAARAPAWYLVHADGQVSKLAGKPDRREAMGPVAGLGGFGSAGAGSVSSLAPGASLQSAITKSLGKRPMVAAVEDGWPMADGTAVLARDGALARVRLQDGALVDFAPDAFGLKPARCHPLALGGANDAGAFGFVCGEPRGKTVIYAYDAAHGRLAELRRFDRPRVVLASGTGAVAVRGGCAEDAPSEDADMLPLGGSGRARSNAANAANAPAASRVSYCIRAADGPWREVQLHGQLSGDRMVALADGRVVVVSPPHGDLGAARLTVLDASKKVTTVPIVFPTLAPDVARVMRQGLWLDGFEERGHGVIGGWVEAAGTFLGVQIQLDGHARAGAYVRDAGFPIVSGRYGLGWTASRRGYETTDGGMTWDPVDLPEPIAPTAQSRSSTVRACGPAGCVAAGWVRIGWGPPKVAPMDASLTSRGLRRPTPIVELACEPTRHVAAAPPIQPARAPIVMPEVVLPHSVIWSATGGASGPRPLPLSNLDWSPFFAVAAPKLPGEELGLSIETGEPLDRTPRTGPLLRLYAWGAKGTSEWERTSRWIARFTSPYASSQEIQTTQPAPAPRVIIDSSRFATGGGIPRPVSSWQVASADDGQHALLVARRLSPAESVPIELEADKPPLEIRRHDGEPFGAIDAALRAGGRWILTGPQGANELPAAVVWEVEGGVARELVRVPRAADNAIPSLRLAKRPDGRSIGLVVEGQPDPERAVPLRWVLPIDLASGAAGELEPLGSIDFADRDGISACGGDEPGWIVDLPMTSTVHVQTGAAGYPASLRSVTARVRISSERLCIERMSGIVDGSADALTRGAGRAALPARGTKANVGGPGDTATIDVAAFNVRTRYPLRCVKK
ncbi:hypothetical protein [Pendulispora albinea]|uniref:Uncharacterized protein n=1 Tax=Pendulispora albinea TaxID=2741071 RepID=A0ABZ2LZB6_9BACT